MAADIWLVDQSDLDAKAGDDDFDPSGIHSCCRQYNNGSHHRKSPIAALGLGDVTKVFLKCDDGTDLSTHYPSAVKKTMDETNTELDDATKKWFDPAMAV